MDWHDAGMPKAKTENTPIDTEYVGEKVKEKVDTLTPDDRSLGERWHDFWTGILGEETTDNTTNAEATKPEEETQATTEPKVTEAGEEDFTEKAEEDVAQ